MTTTRAELIAYLEAHMADPKYVGLKPNVRGWPNGELEKAVADIKRALAAIKRALAAIKQAAIKSVDPDSIQWPQRLMVFAHDEKTECEEMAAWLAKRGIDRDAEPGRLIASVPYELELIYDVWPNGKVLLLSVDGCAVDLPEGWVEPEVK